MTVFELSYQEPDCWSGSEHGWLWAAAGESAKRASRIVTVNASIDQSAISLGMATLTGASIGFERQWRQRMAGLRTNTLVAVGAASFVIFAGLFPDEGSPTRVAAQVVSGIGFLGAGIIFREGLHVTGLNTAATLWCSAAVGLLAGSGHPLHAALATVFVVLVNLTLRPLVRIINRQPITQGRNRPSLSRQRRLPKSGSGPYSRVAAAEHRQRTTQSAATRQHRPRGERARRSHRAAHGSVEQRRRS
jgi:uncharacterized membrane protein YhiD involved in acid resistance